MRILVVEDSPIARVMLIEMLSLRGHETVAEAETMQDALAAFAKHRPDLVTLDLSLGQDSGLNVIKELKKIDRAAKILVISGNVQKGIRDKVLESGAAGIIVKPFSLADLDSALAGLTPK
ncbi:MAG: response regulator [Elusimicrobia bacterium]|nr:response regulator [Elusimicrobiota bacterium]